MNEDRIIENNEEENPSSFADYLGVLYTQVVTSKFKKENGQFFTPSLIADLMASLCTIDKQKIRILDPGCGTSILTCSLVEHLVIKHPNIELIDIVAYETDSNLLKYSESALENLKSWVTNKGISLNYRIHNCDFILANSKELSKGANEDLYDVIISNPPYFKLASNDPRVLATKEFVSGQSNIYSIFMGVASRMLKKDGELIFITPRSFASGEYFKAFREHFFNKVQLERIHLFNSRKETFNRDKVLQETIVLKAKNKKIQLKDKVVVSCCSGLNDISNSECFDFELRDLVNYESKEMILHLPTSVEEINILNLIRTWNNVLKDFNINISTGPVVSFRAQKFLIDKFVDDQTVPLFWLHNVKKMILEWPKAFKEKAPFIQESNESKGILIPNKNYILLRRFSTKDDNSRLIAAPYFCNSTKSNVIGVENKVNYIYRKDGHLNRDETVGLCALLNSELFDTYFRIFNGNVNVSATELRTMRFPSVDDIRIIGNIIILSNDYSMANVNKIVNEKYNWKL